MIALLKSKVKEMQTGDYLAAKMFLLSLGGEVRYPMAPAGLVAR